MGNHWKQWQAIFLGSKITADGDCCHEIKRRLFLERKAMTNLDSVLKSRDITLLTKIHIVKATIFPVVLYGRESWTITKAEHQRIDAFELWCWRRLLRIPWTAKRSNQSILKEILKETWIFIGRTDADVPIYFGHLMWRDDSLEEPTHWKRSWCWERLRAGGEGATEDEMVGWPHWLKGHEFEQTPGYGVGQGRLVCCSPWGCKVSDTTERPNNN